MSSSTSPPPFLPFSEGAEITRTANRLPHWEQGGRAYFVTFRLADSLPQELLDQWEAERAAWLAQHPEPWAPLVEADYHRLFSHRIDQALDAGHGGCVLRQPEIARLVGHALEYFEGTRCRQLAWVVMPNHVHGLFTLLENWTLADLLHSWKSFTAKAINKALGTTGRVWQKDYFDRLIRDPAHFANCVRYMRDNPVRARLREGEWLAWESAYAKTVK